MRKSDKDRDSMTKYLPILPDVPMAVRVSDLRQWSYCPRTIWWTHVCRVGKLISHKMRRGMEKELRLHHLQRRRNLSAFGMRLGTVRSGVTLYAKQIGLSGRLDMLIEQDMLRIPVEVKYTRTRGQLGHKIQLTGYALMLEELDGTRVEEGYIIYLPDEVVERIEITEALREMTRSAIEAVREVLHRETMPPPNGHSERCVDCEYRVYCSDIPATQDWSTDTHQAPYLLASQVDASADTE